MVNCLHQENNTSVLSCLHKALLSVTSFSTRYVLYSVKTERSVFFIDTLRLPPNAQEFYMSGCSTKTKSVLDVMWTNQHGTGPKTDDRVETQIILQYMCQPYPEGKMATADVNREYKHHTIRNGQAINQQAFKVGARENSYIRRDFGLHEPVNFYEAFYRRERHKSNFLSFTCISSFISTDVSFSDAANLPF